MHQGRVTFHRLERFIAKIGFCSFFWGPVWRISFCKFYFRHFHNTGKAVIPVFLKGPSKGPDFVNQTSSFWKIKSGVNEEINEISYSVYCRPHTVWLNNKKIQVCRSGQVRVSYCQTIVCIYCIIYLTFRLKFWNWIFQNFKTKIILVVFVSFYLGKITFFVQVEKVAIVNEKEIIIFVVKTSWEIRGKRNFVTEPTVFEQIEAPRGHLRKSKAGEKISFRLSYWKS